MRIRVIAVFLCSFLGACAGGSQPAPLPPIAPGGNGGGPPPLNVAIHEFTVQDTPEYIGADSNGAYFGYGSSGTGSNLDYFSGGNVTQTMPANPAGGYDGGAGVYGISVMGGTVYWLSAYFDDRSSLPSVQIQCGAGVQASLCEQNVEEPTSMVIDANNVFWAGGLTADGGGEIRTSSGSGYDSADHGIIALVDGPQQSVWGILRPSGSGTDSIVQFATSGNSVIVAHQYMLPVGSMAGSITTGGDGNLWFTDAGTSKLARMTPQGALQEFPSPHTIALPQYGESQIATACDGAVWYTEAGAGAVVRSDTTGAMKEYVLPGAGYAGPIAAVAPRPPQPCSRTLWVGEITSRKVAQITY